MTGVPDAIDPDRALGPRVGAASIDLLLLLAVFIVIGIATGSAHSSGGNHSVNLQGASAGVFFALVFAYYLVSELLWAATPGKRALGLTVVALDGARPTARQIVLRNVGRVIDILPALYFVGFVAMLASARRQRLGDRMAGTTVVKAAIGHPVGP